MGWASLYILYVYINSKVAKNKLVLSSSCINTKCVVTDFIRHYLKLAFCEENCSKSWPNLILSREKWQNRRWAQGFISGKRLRRHSRGPGAGGLFFPWPPKVGGCGWLPNTPPLGSVQRGDTGGETLTALGLGPTLASLVKWCRPQLRLGPWPYSLQEGNWVVTPRPTGFWAGAMNKIQSPMCLLLPQIFTPFPEKLQIRV